MSKNSRCHCGLPAISGLTIPLPQRHYDEYQWGKNWASKCEAKVIEVKDMKTGKIITYKGPKTAAEAVRNAYAQLEMKNYNTWGYAKYNKLVQVHAGQVMCGEYKKPKGRKAYPRFVAKVNQ